MCTNINYQKHVKLIFPYLLTDANSIDTKIQNKPQQGILTTVHCSISLL